LIGAGFAFMVFAVHYPAIQLFSVLCIVFFIAGIGLSVAAIVEARRMSELNISKTRAKIEASIRDARSKLGVLAADAPTSTETGHDALSASPQSTGSADTAP
jgi:hypothetical protein